MVCQLLDRAHLLVQRELVWGVARVGRVELQEPGLVSVALEERKGPEVAARGVVVRCGEEREHGVVVAPVVARPLA